MPTPHGGNLNFAQVPLNAPTGQLVMNPVGGNAQMNLTGGQQVAMNQAGGQPMMNGGFAQLPLNGGSAQHPVNPAGGQVPMNPAGGQFPIDGGFPRYPTELFPPMDIAMAGVVGTEVQVPFWKILGTYGSMTCKVPTALVSPLSYIEDGPPFPPSAETFGPRLQSKPSTAPSEPRHPTSQPTGMLTWPVFLHLKTRS